MVDVVEVDIESSGGGCLEFCNDAGIKGTGCSSSGRALILDFDELLCRDLSKDLTMLPSILLSEEPCGLVPDLLRALNPSVAGVGGEPLVLLM